MNKVFRQKTVEGAHCMTADRCAGTPTGAWGGRRVLYHEQSEF